MTTAVWKFYYGARKLRGKVFQSILYEFSLAFWGGGSLCKGSCNFFVLLNLEPPKMNTTASHRAEGDTEKQAWSQAGIRRSFWQDESRFGGCSFVRILERFWPCEGWRCHEGCTGDQLKDKWLFIPTKFPPTRRDPLVKQTESIKAWR